MKSHETTIIGSSPSRGRARNSIVVEFVPPTIMRWADVLGGEHATYAHRHHEKGCAVIVRLFGRRHVIERLIERQHPAICQLELRLMRVAPDRRYIGVYLYLTNPARRITHEVAVVPAPKQRPSYVYTTTSMNGTGVAVRRLR